MHNEYKKISALLNEYEDLFRRDPSSALKNMIDLYPQADRAMNHETTDAIELWITDHMDQTIIDYLKRKIQEDSKYEPIFTRWISSVDR